MDLNNILRSDYYANKSKFGCVLEFEELALRTFDTSTQFDVPDKCRRSKAAHISLSLKIHK